MIGTKTKDSKQNCYDFLFKPGGCNGRCTTWHRTSHSALHVHRRFTQDYLRAEGAERIKPSTAQ